VCVGGGGQFSPKPSPQISLSVHEVKTDRITVADFPIDTGRTTRLIRGRSSKSYLILFDGSYATSIVLRVYLLVSLFARAVLRGTRRSMCLMPVCKVGFT
jgi:hypothetical protein